jgi:hypothetical protein
MTAHRQWTHLERFGQQERIANTSTLRRRPPRCGRGPRDMRVADRSFPSGLLWQRPLGRPASECGSFTLQCLALAQSAC